MEDQEVDGEVSVARFVRLSCCLGVYAVLDRLSDEGKLDKHVEGNVYWIQFELLW
jgi:hypothetical protein